jgi:hypothetical protein
MASTARMFFAESDGSGGFPNPKDAFARVQTSSSCYIVSACMWFTLMTQKHMPDSEHAGKAIDAAHCARHLVTVDDKTLLNRVVDGGGNAYTLADRVGILVFCRDQEPFRGFDES